VELLLTQEKTLTRGKGEKNPGVQAKVRVTKNLKKGEKLERRYWKKEKRKNSLLDSLKGKEYNLGRGVTSRPCGEKR